MGWKTNFSLALMSSAAIAVTPAAGSAMTFTEAADLPDIWPAQTLAVGTTRVEGSTGGAEYIDIFVFPNVAAGDVKVFFASNALEVPAYPYAQIGSDMSSNTAFFSSATYLVHPSLLNIGDTGSSMVTISEFAGGDLGVYVSLESGATDYCFDIAGMCEGFAEAAHASEPAAAALIGAALVGVGAASRRRAKRR